jgi:3'(2'), 5'-bisphosphate nucleotidase
MLVMTAVPSLDLLSLLPKVEALARQAGTLILAIYGGDFTVQHKPDASPVTLADEQAEALIVPALQALLAAVPVVAEEAESRGQTTLIGERFWLVDPLDGTREFVSRNGEFTVNIALIEDGAPVLGVIFVPVTDKLYAAVVGQGAWLEETAGRRAITCRHMPADGATLACSRSHGDEVAMQAWLQGRAVAVRITAGSSLKFGLVASGQTDLYPRFGRTMEWDTAAGHAIVLAAGGGVCDLNGAPLRYGKPGFENPSFFAHGLL